MTLSIFSEYFGEYFHWRFKDFLKCFKISYETFQIFEIFSKTFSQIFRIKEIFSDLYDFWDFEISFINFHLPQSEVWYHAKVKNKDFNQLEIPKEG